MITSAQANKQVKYTLHLSRSCLTNPFQSVKTMKRPQLARSCLSAVLWDVAAPCPYWVQVPRHGQGAAGPPWDEAGAAPCQTWLVPASSGGPAAGYRWTLQPRWQCLRKSILRKGQKKLDRKRKVFPCSLWEAELEQVYPEWLQPVHHRSKSRPLSERTKVGETSCNVSCLLPFLR